MEAKDQQPGNKKEEKEEKEREELPGYPVYPSSEDIYNRNQKETDIDPENLIGRKGVSAPGDDPAEADAHGSEAGNGLDIPGAELDDDLEEIGSEDEENNYYSLGGDNHDDLEENHDDPEFDDENE